MKDDNALAEADAAATPLSPEERLGLIPTFITTRDALNEAEQLNILEAETWAARRRRDVLDIAMMRRLHRQMFGLVWRWAGNWTTQHLRRIGVDYFQVEPELKTLIETVAFWIEHQTFSPDEIAARFHHRLTWIHPFPNGNGRMSRQAADMLIQSLGGEKLPWGRGDLRSANETRRAYIDALRQADQHDFTALILFARSGEK